MEKMVVRLATLFSASTASIAILYLLGSLFNFGYFLYFGVQLSLLKMPFQEMITPHPRLICMTVMCYAMSRAFSVYSMAWKFLKGLAKDLHTTPEPEVRKWGPVLVLIPIGWVGFIVGCLMGYSWRMYVLEYTFVLMAAGAIVTIADRELTGMRLILWSSLGLSSIAVSFAGFGLIAAHLAKDSLPSVTISLESPDQTLSGQLLYFNGDQYFIRIPESAEIQVLNATRMTELRYKLNGPNLRGVFE